MGNCLIYRDLRVYRILMTLLYAGQYRTRFDHVCRLFRNTDSTVLELCFGDVAIAEFCRRQGVRWTGLDTSESFVGYARRRGYDARLENVARTDAFPACDVCIMIGSLYQFKSQLHDIFPRLKCASSRLLLSEPVRNWTHASGVRGFLARTLSDGVPFRFDERSLIQTLDALQKAVGFDYRVVSVARDMLVEVTWSP